MTPEEQRRKMAEYVAKKYGYMKEATEGLGDDPLAARGAPPVPTDVDITEPNGTPAPVKELEAFPAEVAANPEKLTEEDAANPATPPEDWAAFPKPGDDLTAPPLVDAPDDASKSMRWKAMMALARRRGDDRSLGAGVLKGANMIGAAISGVKPSAAFDDLEKQARRPEAEAQQDITNELSLDRAMRGPGGKSLDPKSPESQAAQTAFINSQPELAQRMGGEAAVRAMSAEQLEKRVSGVLRGDALDFTQSEAPLKHAEKDRALGNAENAATAVQNRFDATNSVKLGDTLGTFAELGNTMKFIDRVAPGMMYGQAPEELRAMAENLPVTQWDFGSLQQAAARATGGLSRRTTPAQMQQVKSAINNFKDLLVRLRTGAVINDSEMASYNQLFSSNIFDSPDAASMALDMFRRNISAKLRARTSGYRAYQPEVYSRTAAEAGLDVGDPIFGDGPIPGTNEREVRIAPGAPDTGPGALGPAPGAGAAKPQVSPIKPAAPAPQGEGWRRAKSGGKAGWARKTAAGVEFVED